LTCRRHGLSKTAEYGAWYQMIYREPVAGVAPRWGVFEEFLADMGRRPTRRHRLGRIDPRLPWGPGNALWARSPGPGRRTLRAKPDPLAACVDVLANRIAARRAKKVRP
jgi:hypothetical protein